MNNLVKIFATLLLLCVATITFAQSQNQVRSISSVKYLIEKLDLTDQQVKRIQSFMEAQNNQLIALRNSDIERSELMPEINRIRTNNIKAVKSVLTEEQVEIYNGLLAQRNKTGNSNLKNNIIRESKRSNN